MQDYSLFCPYAYRLPSGALLAKDLAVEYKYLSESSEWFYIARKKAEEVIGLGNAFKTGTKDGKCSYDNILVEKVFYLFSYHSRDGMALFPRQVIVLRQCLFERS